MGEIASWMYGPKHFSMKVHDVQAGDKLFFYTKAGAEITDLLEDYIQAVVELRRKHGIGAGGTLTGPGPAASHPATPVRPGGVGASTSALVVAAGLGSAAAAVPLPNGGGGSPRTPPNGAAGAPMAKRAPAITGRKT
jgi:hypothetical protein